MKTLLIITLLATAFYCNAQVTLFYENFNSGSGTNVELNTTDIVDGSACVANSFWNQWIINNSYYGVANQDTRVYCQTLGGNEDAYTDITSTPDEPSCISGSPESYYLHIYSPFDADSLSIFNADWFYGDGICVPYENYFAKTKQIVTTGYTGVQLSFWWVCGGETVWGQLYYSTNGGSTWTQLGSNYSNQLTWTQQTLTNAAFDNQADLRFGFLWVNHASSETTKSDPAFSIDDIIVDVPNTGTPNSILRGTLNTNTFCAGSTVNVPFTSTGTFDAGNTYYVRLSDANGNFVNSTIIGSIQSSANSGVIPATIPGFINESNQYLMRVESDAPLVTGNNGSNIDLRPLVPVSAFAYTPSTTLCSAAPTTFTVVSNGFSTPYPSGFQWYVNGNAAGADNSTYTYTPSNGDEVKVVTTSTAACVTGSPNTSNTITITIAANTPATVMVLSNPPAGSAVCNGAPVTFVAIPSNGGSSPRFIWKANGLAIDSALSGPVYSFYSMPAGSSVTCTVVADSGCSAGPDSATSAPLTFNTDTVLHETVTLSPNFFCGYGLVKLNSTDYNTRYPFLWQYSPAATGFSTVLGATSFSDSVHILQTTFFRVIQQGQYCADTSNVGIVIVGGFPDAGFGYIQSGATLNFSSDYYYAYNNNTAPVILDWNFGDGSPHSNLLNPSHTYASDGTYTICLNVYSGTGCTGCHADSCQSVIISAATGIAKLAANNFSVSPNPFSTTCIIETSIEMENATLQLFDITGRVVLQMKNVSGKEIILPRNDLPGGMYLLKLRDNNGNALMGKVMIE